MTKAKEAKLMKWDSYLPPNNRFVEWPLDTSQKAEKPAQGRHERQKEVPSDKK